MSTTFPQSVTTIPGDFADTTIAAGIHASRHNDTSDTLTAVQKVIVGPTWYNVKNPDFAGGAKGDGVTDDAPAIQATLTACHTGGGGKVVLPPDVTAGPTVYGIASGLTIYSNTEMEIPVDVTLKALAGCTGDMISNADHSLGNANIHLRGHGTVDGSSIANYCIHIYGNILWPSSISDLRIVSALINGIRGETPGGVTNTYGVWVTRCEIQSCGIWGLYLTGLYTSEYDIAHCHIHDNGALGGAGACGGAYTDSPETSFSSNRFWQNGKNTNGRGLYFHGPTLCSAVDNEFNSDGYRAGIEIDNSGSDNILNANRLHDIGYPGTAGVSILLNVATRNLVTSNKATSGGTTPTCGIQEIGASDNNTINSNSIYRHTTDILILGASTIHYGNKNTGCTGGITPIRFAGAGAPATLADGDFWYDGTNLKIRVGAVTKTVTIV